MEQNAQKPLDRVKKQIEVWANELIDLSRRNTSLYYRKTKRSTLELESPPVEEFVALLSGGGERSFYEPPQPAELEDDEPWTVEDSLEGAKAAYLTAKADACLQELGLYTAPVEYRVNEEHLTLQEHEKKAREWGGHVSSVADQKELDLIRGMVNNREVMLGGERTGPGREDWKWLDGTKWEFTMWERGVGLVSGVK